MVMFTIVILSVASSTLAAIITEKIISDNPTQCMV
jgi:hypothetical protein